MRPAGFLLLLPAGLASLAIAEDSRTGLVSRELKAHIREGLPAFDPAPSARAAANDAGPGPGAANPDVLVLPKVVIKERRLPPDAADRLKSRKEFNRKMENLYLDHVAAGGRLNYFLNAITIPILSPSKADRGRALYRQAEIDRLSGIGAMSRGLDPAAAKELAAELERATRPPPPLQVIK